MPAFSTLGLLGGAAMGAGKAAAGQARANKLTDLSAETARYSPWTGMDPNKALAAAESQDTDMFGNILGGGLSGASFGQSVDKLPPSMFDKLPELKMPEFQVPDASKFEAPQVQSGLTPEFGEQLGMPQVNQQIAGSKFRLQKPSIWGSM